MAKIEMVINVPVVVTLDTQEGEDTEGVFHRAAKGLKHWAEECTKRRAEGYAIVLIQSRVIPDVAESEVSL